MKHVKNILVFIILWSIGYYFGVESTYQQGFQGTDLVSIIAFVGGLYWIIKK